METLLDFEKDGTKELLSKYNFEFFLKLDIKENTYSQEQIDLIYQSFHKYDSLIKNNLKEHGRQYNYFLEGMVRKMYMGKMIPALFHLNDAKKHSFFDFEAVGENWAYFARWQKYYKRKITLANIWDVVIKSGSILGIGLSILKLIEYL